MMLIEEYPTVMLYRNGAFIKPYPHQLAASVLHRWLRHQAAPVMPTVAGLPGLAAAVAAAAEAGRAVAAQLLPAAAEPAGTAATANGRLAAARLGRHDYVDFVAVSGLPATTVEGLAGGTVVLAECAGLPEVEVCLAAAAAAGGSSEELPLCCLGAVLPEELPAGGDTAVRWLSDWVYDHDVPLLGQITDRNAARYPLRPRGPLRMRVRVEGRR